MSSIRRKLTDEAATIALGQELSLFARNGLTICLYGDLGAGKTTLARALIQSLTTSKFVPEVPSPTFSLLQPYDQLRMAVHHYDLYRIKDADEAIELGLLDDPESRLTIIEWPERLGGDIPAERIDVFLTFDNGHRSARIVGHKAATGTVGRIKIVAEFLATGKWHGARREFLQGDASARRYERLTGPDGNKAILMDMPAMPDGPVIKDGKTYSHIAHIAEGITPVAAVNKKLRELGFSAPASLQEDLPNGLMVIEDFGDDVFGARINHNRDISLPIQTATKLLAEMCLINWPTTTDQHTVANFDFATFRMEASLLLDWFWPLQKGQSPDEHTKTSFYEIWAKLFNLTETDHRIWVLRDFHSPNLIWMPDRSGIRRVGLIDTQDCILGHPAYDLVSMLQDARMDLPDGFEAKYFEYYCDLRRQREPLFDAGAFATAYAVLGAQRATKILGIFARLYQRDGKSGYLGHIGRVSAALEKNLRHPALADLASWYNEHLSAKERIVRMPE